MFSQLGIYPYIFFVEEMYLKILVYAIFGGYRNKNCSAVLPTHLQLCVNVAHAPMNGVQRLHTAPSFFLQKGGS